jgi:alkylated DNA repair protein alkB family protein 1
MTQDEEKGGLISAFKQAQLRYRRRGGEPEYDGDLTELIDFCNNNDDRIMPLALPDNHTVHVKLYSGPIFGLKPFPGFLFAPQALSSEIQTVLAFRAVSEFCEPPHATNIDLVAPKRNEESNMNQSMWTLWKEQRIFEKSKEGTQWDNGATKLKKYRCFDKLSWATMGYQYDWTSRSYHEGCKSEMPHFLQSITEIFARASLLLNNSPTLGYTASATIVNFYSSKSLMGGHRDDLEKALDKPIVSISLGCAAIFLLGGLTKDETPVVPILVRPGDVMVLGGKSRLAYHSMARVIPSTVKLPKVPEFYFASNSQVSFTDDLLLIEQAKLDEMSELDKQALELFLSLYRININVRQVYAD